MEVWHTLAGMDEETLQQDWLSLMAYLPELHASAKTHRFTRRSTGRHDAQTWLRLILMHAAGGLSLAQTVSRAAQRGWATVSSVALHKRWRLPRPGLSGSPLTSLSASATSSRL